MTCPEPPEESRLHEDVRLGLLLLAVALVLLSLAAGGLLAWLLGPVLLVKLGLLGLGSWLVGWALYRMGRGR